MKKQSHRKFSENFNLVLFQILRFQDITIRSMFDTLFFKVVQYLWFSNSKLQSNKHTLSQFLKQTHFLGNLEKLFLETVSAVPGIFFCLQVCTFTISCIIFYGGFVKHIESKNQPAKVILQHWKLYYALRWKKTLL